jgi:uncharacterized membrane protein
MAFSLHQAVFWRASAIIAAFGVVGGALAATAGALDISHAQRRGAGALAITHAILMGSAWSLAAIGLFGRVNGQFAVSIPAPWWTIAASAASLLLMIGGAWCGGEMVYGRGVGVRDTRCPP